MKGELALQKQRNVKLTYDSFPQQHHLKRNTKLFFSWAVSNRILQTATVLLSTAAQCHKIGQACAVCKDFVLAQAIIFLKSIIPSTQAVMYLFAGYFM